MPYVRVRVHVRVYMRVYMVHACIRTGRPRSVACGFAASAEGAAAAARAEVSGQRRRDLTHLITYLLTYSAASG